MQSSFFFNPFEIEGDVLNNPEPPSSNPASREPFLKLIEGLEPQPFINTNNVRKIMIDHYFALGKGETRNQWLAFTNVPASVAMGLTSDENVHGSTRLSHDNVTETLIVKVMPSPEHGLISKAFAKFLFDDILAMGLKPEMKRFVGITVMAGDRWIKEPDRAWNRFLPIQLSTEPVLLSTVFLVGLAESSHRLDLDAIGWLETEDSTVSTAITISTTRNKDTPQVTVKFWELAPPSALSIPTPKAAYCSKEITVVCIHDDIRASDDLIIPFEKLVGRPPTNPDERDFFISRKKLEEIAEEVWSEQIEFEVV